MTMAPLTAYTHPDTCFHDNGSFNSLHSPCVFQTPASLTHSGPPPDRGGTVPVAPGVGAGVLLASSGSSPFVTAMGHHHGNPCCRSDRLAAVAESALAVLPAVGVALRAESVHQAASAAPAVCGTVPLF